MARRARLKTRPQKTAESARSLLIARGCEATRLQFLVECVNLGMQGASPLLPTHPSDVFKLADSRKLDRLEKEILALSNTLSTLWTERGKLFIQNTIKPPLMLDMPKWLGQYWLELKTLRRALETRRPATLDVMKSMLVQYVYDATGRRRWHDAELALLCAQEHRAWAKWRADHYRPLPKTRTSHTGDSRPGIELEPL